MTNNCAAQLDDARQRLASIDATISQTVRLARDAKSRIDTAKTAHTEAVTDATVKRQARELLVALADSRREVVRDRVERLVSAALRAVFPERAPLFRLDVSIKRGQVSMIPQIGYTSATGVDWVGLDSVGGGVIDVVSFTLRVAVLTMVGGDHERLIVADEPFKHVSQARIAAVSELVAKLAHRCGIQFLIVSHEPELAAAADRVFRVNRIADGKSSRSVIAQETDCE